MSLIKRLSEEAMGTGAERAGPAFIIRIGGNQDNRGLARLTCEALLQIETTKTWHLQIGNHASRSLDAT